PGLGAVRQPSPVDTHCPRSWTGGDTRPAVFGELLAIGVDKSLSRKLDKRCTKCDASRVQKRGHERRTVVPRYRLHAGELLRRLLDSQRDGEPGSVRELAAAVGMSKSKVAALVREVRPTLTGDEARRLAQAYGLPPRALFHP